MKQLLIIDDEKDFSRFAKANLEHDGAFLVRTALSGAEGIKLATDYLPDVILLDIVMPGIDGFEVLRRLKADSRTMSIPVMLLTAIDDDMSRFKAAELYIEDYISKPVSVSVLKEKIEKVIARRQ